MNPNEPYLFNPRLIGESLKQVAVDIVQSENQGIESRWFHSQNDADLFFWKDKQKNIIKHQMTFLGQVLVWDIVDGLRTGVVVDDETAGKSESALIKFDQSPQKQTVMQGIEILVHVGGLSSEEKQKIIKNCSQALGQTAAHSFKNWLTHLGLWFKKK